MKMPNGYNETQARTGAREQLPPGGYVCRIRGAREETSNGYWRLVIAFDVHEGDHAGFFERRYKEDLQAGKEKWPAAGTHRIFVLDYNDQSKCSPEFKGFITSVEESNPGFIMQWGEGSERALVGKLVGIVFREEEFFLQDGSGIGVATKPMYACGIGRIREGVKVPKRKKVKGEAAPPPAYPTYAPPEMPDYGTDDGCPF